MEHAAKATKNEYRTGIVTLPALLDRVNGDSRYLDTVTLHKRNRFAERMQLYGSVKKKLTLKYHRTFGIFANALAFVSVIKTRRRSKEVLLVAGLVLLVKILPSAYSLTSENRATFSADDNELTDRSDPEEVCSSTLCRTRDSAKQHSTKSAKHRLRPYHPHLFRGLTEDDYDQRVEFCEAFMENLEVLNTDKILWTDEAIFKLKGHLNRCNMM
ncbi:hypothetical protein M514_11220 [Trichuris suis]|uniref:Uncharacterized protein n=1 Tax=Trichuris suis TaxID=68888 RepID=A0A085LSI3_9BILA|nr:hypothetical protein M513_11220 [Trichuris suis]KFD68000.1 hypothetical protein M514_11220 [Trichuris suis]